MEDEMLSIRSKLDQNIASSMRKLLTKSKTNWFVSKSPQNKANQTGFPPKVLQEMISDIVE